MRIGIRLLVLALIGCAQGESTPVDGAWRSNRELTLVELSEARDFTQEQWKTLSDPTMFGQMVHIYRGNSGITVFEGECSPVNSFELLDPQPDSVKIRYFDEFWDEERTILLTVEGDRLYVPISMLKGQLRETFTRVPFDQVLQEHPCTRAFIEGSASSQLTSR